MNELRQKYAEKKSSMRKKYADVVNKIAMARGVDVGVAFEMLLAVCRGGDYLNGIDLSDNVADVVNGGETIAFDLDELNADYFELCQLSEQIARANGLLD